MSKEHVNCELCSKQLSKTSLRRHMHYMHSDQSKLDKVHCVLCDYAPRCQSNLENHIINVHLGVKKWKCMLCDFTSGGSGGLTNHVRSVHLKEEDYKCQLCDVTFSSIPSLNLHIKAAH
jgi:hypothetical protein